MDMHILISLGFISILCLFGVRDGFDREYTIIQCQRTKFANYQLRNQLTSILNLITRRAMLHFINICVSPLMRGSQVYNHKPIYHTFLYNAYWVGNPSIFATPMRQATQLPFKERVTRQLSTTTFSEEIISASHQGVSSTESTRDLRDSVPETGQLKSTLLMLNFSHTVQLSMFCKLIFCNYKL